MSHTLRERIGNNLRVLRLARGLTQEELAAILGVSARYFAAIERAERNLTLDTVDGLAAQLGTTGYHLIVGDSRPSSSSSES